MVFFPFVPSFPSFRNLSALLQIEPLLWGVTAPALTMIVMMIASTPLLNASGWLFPVFPSQWPTKLPATTVFGFCRMLV